MEAQVANRIHPLIAGASVAVIIAAGVAVAAITGHLPGSKAETAPTQTAAAHAVKPAKEHKPVAVCHECGTIVEVKEVEVLGKGTGVGAVAGGVGGAVIGHQIGENRTGTVVGAAVGAVAGHQIEREARKHTRYDITVHMTDGSTRKFSDESGAQIALKSGDKVRVGQDGSLKPI
jgi:outer membrane lipoprotein SlyB